MSAWVLIVYLMSGHSGGPLQVPGFTSQDMCETAGTKIERDSGFMYEWHSCIKVK